MYSVVIANLVEGWLGTELREILRENKHASKTYQYSVGPHITILENIQLYVLLPPLKSQRSHQAL